MFLKKFFPLSFTKSLFTSILIYVLVALLAGIPIGALPFFIHVNSIWGLFVRLILWALAGFIEIYSVVGIILSILFKSKRFK